MARQRVPERELTQGEKDTREELLAYFGQQGSIITHKICEAGERATRTQRDFVAVVKQHHDERRLMVVGCPLGSPPQHEGGASGLGDYEQVLAKLDTQGWSDAEKRAIRAFITTADEAAAEDALPRRRRGKRRRD